MSKFEWESGKIKLPVSAWVGFKRELRTAHDRLQDKAFALAVTIHTEVTVAGQGKRGFNYSQEAVRLFNRKFEQPTTSWRSLYALPNTNRSEGLEHYRDSILLSLFPKREQRRPRKPQRKDFPRARSKTTAFSGCEWGIFLDDAERTFCWTVSENNRSVERAHEHPLASAAFGLLDKVKWTRGTGGKLVGNNEYNEESREDGGGANFVTRRYGQLGEDEHLKLLRRVLSKRAGKRRARSC